MIKSLHFNGPINSLSLGNVSVNFLRELKDLDVDVSLFAEGDRADFSAYDKIDQHLADWIKTSGLTRYQKLNKDVPVLKNWHINGSEKRVVPEQYLYTYYEVDSPTKEEINIVKSQKHVFFSSSEAAQIFRDAGCDNVSHVPLGFDKDFHIIEQPLIPQNVVHFGLIGKFEKRKNTKQIIKAWISKYGGNPNYLLTCLINNPFYKEEDFRAIVFDALGGKAHSNVNILPFLKTNSEVNHLINSIDVNLSGLSNGEGWNLPAFNSCALGKWSIVSNCSSHKDWATETNSILVEPEGKQDCYDGKFFIKDMPFNQGQYYKISTDSMIHHFEVASEIAKTRNTSGIRLQEDFTYKKSVEKILAKIVEDR